MERRDPTRVSPTIGPDRDWVPSTMVRDSVVPGPGRKNCVVDVRFYLSEFEEERVPGRGIPHPSGFTRLLCPKE